MTIFATPDFGAAGAIALVLLVVWAVVLAFVVLGIRRRGQKFRSESPADHKCGLLLLLGCAVVPLLCWQGPPHAVRLAYGNYPLGRYPNRLIEEGTLSDEVRRILGGPHERVAGYEGTESRYYWIDSFGARYFGVQFDSNGRVTGTHGN
jgi:hypothetical protein